MTDAEINAKIAELIGWKNVRCNEGGNVFYGEPDDDFNRDVEKHRKHGQCGFPVEPHREEVPDFCNDLNLWQQIENMLERQYARLSVENKARDYWIALMEIVNPGIPLWDNGTFLGSWGNAIKVGHATARQRAEAFLRVKG